MAPPCEKENSLLNISEAAEFLHVSKVTIRRWTDNGKLPCTRVGSRQERQFAVADLQKLLPKPRPSIRRNGKEVDQSGVHRCILCDNSNQGWNAIVEETMSHLADGAHVTFIGDDARKKRLTISFERRQHDLKTYVKTGQLRLLSVEDSYLVSGTFSGLRAAAFVESTILDAKSKGFDGSLFVGWSDWLSAAQKSDFDSLASEVFEYEQALNNMILRYPLATVLCPYSYFEIPVPTLFELATNHPQIQFQSQHTYALNSSADAR